MQCCGFFCPPGGGVLLQEFASKKICKAMKSGYIVHSQKAVLIFYLAA